MYIVERKFKNKKTEPMAVPLVPFLILFMLLFIPPLEAP